MILVELILGDVNEVPFERAHARVALLVTCRITGRHLVEALHTVLAAQP